MLRVDGGHERSLATLHHGLRGLLPSLRGDGRMRARGNSELGCAGQLSQSLRTYVDTNSDTVDLHRAAFHRRPHRFSQGRQQDLADHFVLVCGHFDLMQHQSHSRASRGGLCHALPVHLFLLSRDEEQKVHARRPDVCRHLDLPRAAERAVALSETGAGRYQIFPVGKHPMAALALGVCGSAMFECLGKKVKRHVLNRWIHSSYP